MPEQDLPRVGGVVVAPVVVGVDGTEDCLPAVRHAAAEATRLGAPLRVVHAAPDHPLLASVLPGGQDRVDQVAREALDRATAAVASTPDRPVVAEVVRGSTVGAVSRAAQGSRLLVIGNAPHARLGLVVTGSTVLGLAARSPVPLVCVPSTWGTGPARDRIVVGLKGPGQGGSLLARAFALASEHGATLEVVHAWRLPGEYDDLLDSPDRLERWRRHTLDELEPLLATCRRRHPQVVAELRICHEQAAQALVKAAARADLVMIARPAHAMGGVHLGSTARGVLREAACPVEISPAISPAISTATDSRPTDSSPATTPSPRSKH